MSLSKLASYFQIKNCNDQKAKGNDLIFAVVGTVTDDTRLIDVPELKVCALKFTEKARERITRNVSPPFPVRPRYGWK